MVKKEDNRNIAIIKTRCKSEMTKSFGFILIFIDRKNKLVDKVTAVVTRSSVIYENYNVHLPWFELEDAIIQQRWKGDFSVSTTNDVQKAIEDHIFDDSTHDILTLISNNKLRIIEDMLADILYRPIRDHHMLMELNIEMVTSEDLEKQREERLRKEQEEKRARDAEKKTTSEAEFVVDIPEGSSLINVFFVLSPIKGIPLYELKVNDGIFVRLDEKTPQGKQFAGILNAIKEDGAFKSVPARVIQVSKNSMGEHLVIVKLREGIFGKIIESEQVKIKSADAHEMEQIGENLTGGYSYPSASEKDFLEAQKKSDRSMLIFIGIGILVLVAIFAAIYFFLT